MHGLAGRAPAERAMASETLKRARASGMRGSMIAPKPIGCSVFRQVGEAL
jgi:hypothetical protein